MQKEPFRTWLLKKRTARSASDCISRCKKVEIALGVDLDKEYQKDFGASIIHALQHGKKEADKGIPFPEIYGFNKQCNVVQSFTDLRCSVNQYFNFCNRGGN